MDPYVLAVSASQLHSFSKSLVPYITLVEGLGVEGDAHFGTTVQHRSRVARNPAQPNLRQVHLIHAELFDELASKGFTVSPGQLGENITTLGVDLLSLSAGAEIHFSNGPVVRITGLRNPCAQIDQFQQGLMGAVLDRTADGRLIRKSGVMGIVVAGGVVRPRDPIHVKAPCTPHRALDPV